MDGPFLQSQLTRANAFCPSTTWPESGGYRYVPHFYAPHGSGLCVLAVWRPSASFQNAPCAVFFGDQRLGNGYGWAKMTTELFTGKLGALAERLSAAGYVIVSCDYPATSLNRHQVRPDLGVAGMGATKILGSWSEVWPIAMWPEQPAYIALALQYLKSHYSGIADDTETIFGATLFGVGNSIDPTRIVAIGKEWGAQCALYAALQPTSYYPHERELAHELMDPYTPRASHRVPAVIALNPGPLDCTQFYVGRYPLQSTYYYYGTTTQGVGNTWDEPPGTPYYLKGDRFQPFMRCESSRRWSRVPKPWKKQSPWWLLQEKHAENANLHLFVEFEGTGYDVGSGGWDENLSASDWAPGTVRSASATGRAFIQPHDGRFQGQPLREALLGYSSDPNVSLPIYQSRVYDPVSTSWPTLSAASFATTAHEWLAAFFGQ